MSKIIFDASVPQSIRKAVEWASVLVPLRPELTHVSVSVGDLNDGDPAGQGTAGQTSHVGDMSYSTRQMIFDVEAIRLMQEDIDKGTPRGQGMLTATPEITAVQHVVLHEWGHVNDTMPSTMFEQMMPGPPNFPYECGAFSLGAYGIVGGDREAYAEAVTAWFASHGKTDNPAANWYARKGKWVVGQPINDPDRKLSDNEYDAWVDAESDIRQEISRMQKQSAEETDYA